MFAKNSESSALKEIISYTYPKLYTGKRWYIGFYAFDPAIGQMHRKTIKVNFVDSKAERRRYASDLCKRITEKLINGWNPWIEQTNSKAYLTFDDVVGRYRRFIDKMFADGSYREETYTGYISYLRIFENWIKNVRSVPITYIYQFTRELVIEFLEYAYIDRNNTAQTRDNYLGFMKVFSNYLVQNVFLKERPTDGINSFGKRSHKKQRTVIADIDVNKLTNYLDKINKHYKLACYILYYCFIRPKELSKLKIENISLKRQTIYIPDYVSKNKKGASVTLPHKVIDLMLDLCLFDSPAQYYIFSDNFLPGLKHRDEKQFRDFWHHHIRKDLKFPSNYKFYSLKDTGITSMLRTQDSITVRDQARHSSILMTDIYTPHDIQEANHLIVNHDGLL